MPSLVLRCGHLQGAVQTTVSERSQVGALPFLAVAACKYGLLSNMMALITSGCHANPKP